jgi:hypothetical protein
MGYPRFPQRAPGEVTDPKRPVHWVGAGDPARSDERSRELILLGTYAPDGPLTHDRFFAFEITGWEPVSLHWLLGERSSSLRIEEADDVAVARVARSFDLPAGASPGAVANRLARLVSGAGAGLRTLAVLQNAFASAPHLFDELWAQAGGGQPIKTHPFEADASTWEAGPSGRTLRVASRTVRQDQDREKRLGPRQQLFGPRVLHGDLGTCMQCGGRHGAHRRGAALPARSQEEPVHAAERRCVAVRHGRGRRRGRQRGRRLIGKDGVMNLDLLGIVRNNGRSNWHFIGSGGGIGASIAVGPVSAGVARGYFDVSSTVHSVDHYRCYFRLLTASRDIIGRSTHVSVNVSPGAFPSQELNKQGYIRLPNAPDQSGEGGDPSGFLGSCLFATLSGAVVGSVDCQLIVLGWGGPSSTFDLLHLDRLVQASLSERMNIMNYKYLGVVQAYSVATAIGASGQLALGSVVKIVNMSRGGVEVTTERGRSTLDYPLADYDNPLDF